MSYEMERALVDKANALFPPGWKGGRVPDEIARHPDFRAVDNAMRSRVEQHEILTASPAVLVAYIKGATVTTWMGDHLGSAREISRWRVNSPYSTTRHAYRCRIGGVDYHGRGYGDGMSIVLRRCK